MQPSTITTCGSKPSTSAASTTTAAQTHESGVWQHSMRGSQPVRLRTSTRFPLRPRRPTCPAVITSLEWARIRRGERLHTRLPHKEIQMATRQIKMPEKDEAQSAPPQPSQHKRPEAGRYLLQVDRQTKGSYLTIEAAQDQLTEVVYGYTGPYDVVAAREGLAWLRESCP